MGAQDRIHDVSRDKLISDMKAVVSDAEELLRATATQAGEKASVARERIQASLAAAKQQLDDTRMEMLQRGREAVDATDELVHEHPWQAVGVAALAGLVLGIMISRR
jgi:ElaB/YqjD/DUF883 family membrane-anchored ribosome-binding protein